MSLKTDRLLEMHNQIEERNTKTELLNPNGDCKCIMSMMHIGLGIGSGLGASIFQWLKFPLQRTIIKLVWSHIRQLWGLLQSDDPKTKSGRC